MLHRAVLPGARPIREDSCAPDDSGVVPIVVLIAEAIHRLHAGGSLGDLFQDAPGRVRESRTLMRE